MRIIRPVEIDNSNLVSSNVPETPPAAYNAGTTYALGDRVSVVTGEVYAVYESLVGSNTGNAPASSPTQWLYLADTYAVYSGSTVYVTGEFVISTATNRAYKSLIGASLGTATITIANPGVVTRAAHGLANGDPVCFTTTGALPTGLTAGTIYYALDVTTDTFKLAATVGGAAIETTGSQSGTHTLFDNPNVGFALTEAGKWQDQGPTNRYAMFDQSNTSATECGGGIDVEVEVSGRADAVALFNIVGNALNVTITTDDDGEIYNEDINLVSTSGISDWWAYFFEPIVRRGDIVLYDLPLNANPTFHVTLTEPSATASIGTMVVGLSRDIGSLVYGAKTGIQDFSRKEQDDFGNFTIVERAFAKRATFKLMVQNGAVDAISTLLSSYRATPVVWVGADEYSSTWLYGWARDWNVEIAFTSHSYLNLELEGLT